MNIIEKSLYRTDEHSFNGIKKTVNEFRSVYTGNNIIQNDIFGIAKNYVQRNDGVLSIFYLPIRDQEFCACTCIRKGQIFMLINSSLSLNKQYFAMAHELYHIYEYINGNGVLNYVGSLLKDDLYSGIENLEEKKANAFAAILMAPGTSLVEQMEVFGISRDRIDTDSIIILMDIFAIPYKAVVLRLFEEKIINYKCALNLLENFSEEKLNDRMKFLNKGLRWQKKTADVIDLDTVPELIKINNKLDFVNFSRIEEDNKFLEEIYEWYSQEWDLS